jgi:uncharacterized phage protein (TIGR02220 family)/predicted phage replisome organizer
VADVKWIKITTDMFDNRKIKHLRRLPDGNNIVLIWVMLLTMAGRCNSNGMVFLTENIPYTPKMLADELDFEENTVILALQALENLNMIVTDSGFFAIAGWQEYQNIDGMDKIREQNRIRQANFKQRQKLLNSNVIDNVTVTEGNATEEDKDKEKEEDKKIYISIVSYLNEKAGTKYKATTDKTKKAIHARLSEGFTVEDFKTVIDKKCAEWIGDPKMEKYLRPETLFGTKFEGYLNAKTTGRNETNGQAARDSSKVRVGNYI